MFKYFQTTTLILLWCLVLSSAWAVVAFYRAARHDAPPPRRQFAGLIAPALVLAPLALVLAFRVVGINLLFPVGFFADLSTLAFAALAPALILVLSSGLIGGLSRQIRTEYSHWSSKTFALMSSVALRRAHHRRNDLQCTWPRSRCLAHGAHPRSQRPCCKRCMARIDVRCMRVRDGAGSSVDRSSIGYLCLRPSPLSLRP
jgi:hypothetical protein